MSIGRNSTRVMIVDDDRSDAERFRQVLRGAGYEVETAGDAESALMRVRANHFDVVLLDMLLPAHLSDRLGFGGVALLRAIKAHDELIQILAVTGYGSRELAAEATAAGAVDYITKDTGTEDRLPGLVRTAAARGRLLRAAALSGEDADEAAELITPVQLVADSAAMRQLLRRIELLAPTDAPLLLLGEPGVGKQLYARVIHLNGGPQRGAGPFEEIDASDASVAALWGSEGQQGTLERARGGTLVLREIEKLSLAQQRQLAEFLVDQEEQVPEQWVRLVATSTTDLERLVRQGRFARPLFEALRLGALRVPALRERRDKDDVLAIAGAILHSYELAPGLAPDAADILARHDYVQGNIEELKTILRIAADNSGGALISAAHLPAELRPALPNYDPTDPIDPYTLNLIFVPSDPPEVILETPAGRTRARIGLEFSSSNVNMIWKSITVLSQDLPSEISNTIATAVQGVLEPLGLWLGGQPVPDLELALGRILYRAVAADPAADLAFKQMRIATHSAGSPLNLELHFPANDFPLVGLPWELIADDDGHLLVGENSLGSCVRYTEWLPLSVEAPDRSRLNVLFVTTSENGMAADTSTGTSFVQELRTLASNGVIELEELSMPTSTQLRERLGAGKSPSIVHLETDVVADGFELTDERFSLDELGKLVSQQTLIYVLPNSLGASFGIVPGAVTHLLCIAGAGAAVAVSSATSVGVVSKFADILYKELLQEGNLIEVLVKARNQLYALLPNSWYGITVEMRVPSIHFPRIDAHQLSVINSPASLLDSYQQYPFSEFWQPDAVMDALRAEPEKLQDMLVSALKLVYPPDTMRFQLFSYMWLAGCEFGAFLEASSVCERVLRYLEKLYSSNQPAVELLREVANEVEATWRSNARVARLSGLGRAVAQLSEVSTLAPKGLRGRLLRELAETWRDGLTFQIGRISATIPAEPVASPFVFTQPVGGIGLIGREDVLRRIHTLWARPGQRNSLIIHGHRRMGKTSLAQAIVSRAGLGDDTLLCYLSLETVDLSHSGYLYFGIADELSIAVPGADPPNLDLFLVASPSTALTSFLRRLRRSPQSRVVLVIDEIEWLGRKLTGEQAAAVLRELRGFTQTYTWLSLALVGLSDLDDLRRSYSNPLLGWESIRVGFLGDAEVARVLTAPAEQGRLPLDFSPTALERIASLTRGQPYLVQVLGDRLVEYFNEQLLAGAWKHPPLFEIDDVDAVAESADFYSAAAAYFSGVWEQFAAYQPLLRALAPYAEGLDRVALGALVSGQIVNLDEALELLQRHDILSQVADRLRFSVPLMRRWAERQIPKQ